MNSFILFNQTHFEVHMSLYLHITLFNFFLISIHRKFFFLWVSFLHNFNLLKCKGSTISQGCSEVKINTNQQLLRNTLFKVCYIKPKREGGRKHVQRWSVKLLFKEVPSVGSSTMWFKSTRAREIRHFGSPSQAGCHFREGALLSCLLVSSLAKYLVHKFAGYLQMYFMEMLRTTEHGNSVYKTPKLL